MQELNAQLLLIVEVTEVAEEAAETVKDAVEKAVVAAVKAVVVVVKAVVVVEKVAVAVVKAVVAVVKAVVVVDAVVTDLELLLMVSIEPRLHTSKEKKVHQLLNVQNAEATEKNSKVSLAKEHIPWIDKMAQDVADAVIAKMVKEKAAGATTRSL